MKGICALYDEETELQESHIHPKFVIKHTKKTGSKYLRSFVNPNKREQDGIKIPLLGFRAEQEFAKREKWFSENIFKPFLNGKHNLEYDENLYYFAISFLWRVIRLELKSGDLSDKWYYNIMLDAEKEWKQYLTKNIIPGKYHNVNILLTKRLEENNSDLKGADFYLTRILDATLVDNKEHTFFLIYGKFNRFIFWSVIKSPPIDDELYEVEIHPNGGTLEIPQKLQYFPIDSFLNNRIRGMENMPEVDQKQQDKIEEEMLKDIDKFWESDVGQSLLNDINLDP